MKNYKLEDLVLVTCTGEGYYSGASESIAVLLPQDLFDEYDDEIVNMSIWFHELDGKHSEVEGKMGYAKFEGKTPEQMRELMEEYYSADGDAYHITERLYDMDERLSKAVEAIEELVNIESITITKITFDGVEV